jgi:glutamate carboxypeptidase
MLPALYDFLKSQRDPMLQTLRTLVEHETPTDDKAAIDRAQEYLSGEFDALGGSVHVFPQVEAGDHLRVEFAGAQEPQLTLLTHIDTVYSLGTLATMPFRAEGRLAYGPGIFDMKGGIVIVLYAFKALQSLGLVPQRKIVCLVTSDEEIGSLASRALIEEEARNSSTVLVLEPGAGPHGSLKTWRKGVGRFTLNVTGRASHAGADPDRGRSAIIELAHQVLQLNALNDAKVGTTVNVGIVSGGSRANVVPADARAEIDVRVMTLAEARRIEDVMQSIEPLTPDTTVLVTGGLNRPPMERTPEIMARYETARALAAQIGIELSETGTGGGSDGNFTAALGTPTLDGLGAVGNGAHSPNEFVVVDRLPQRAAILAGLLMEL